MNPFSIFLVLISTFMHTAWNLMAKHGNQSEHGFFEHMQIGVMLMGIVPFTIGELLSRSIPGEVWIYVFLSGIFGGSYYLFLGNAYGAGDFTLVYPVARSLPVLLMGLVDLARGRMPTALGWAGMFMVASGCILSPIISIREISLKKYFNKSILWITLTALGTVGYSTFDKLSSEIVKQGPAAAAKYCYIFFAFSGIIYLSLRRVIVLRNPSERKHENAGWLKPTLGGIFSYSAYWLVLWAYQLVKRASYVVTFRQFSIVIGSIIAFWSGREKAFPLRVIAILTITLGLVIIALWGK